MKSIFSLIRFSLIAILINIAILGFAQDFYTLGTGTVSTELPFNSEMHDSRTQLLYNASELHAAGISYGTITEIAFNVNSFNNTPLNGLTVMIQTFSDTAIYDFVESNWTIVYSEDHIITKKGWDTLTFNTPFNWNGSDNILLQICFDNSTFGTNTMVNSVNRSYKVFHGAQNYSSGCSISYGNMGYNCPNIMFGIIGPKQTDLAINKFSQPDFSNSINPNNTTSIVVELTNPGLLAQSNFNIKYSIDNGVSYVSETYTQTLNPGDTIDYTFTQTADLSIEGYYELIAIVELVNDSNNYNDTTRAQNIVCNEMSGTYYVGTGKTYPNLTTALMAAQSCGIAGPTKFILEGETFDGFYEISEIYGLNDINTLTIKGQGDNTILINSQAKQLQRTIFKLDGAKHIIIEDLKIETSSKNTLLTAFWLTNGADSNIIRNCYIYLPTAYDYYGILASQNSDNESTGNNANNLLIENNRIEGGYIGISLNGEDQSTFAENNIVRNNTFTNQIDVTLGLTFQSNLLVSENNFIFSPTGVGEIYGSGININSCTKKVLFTKNTLNYYGKNALTISNSSKITNNTDSIIISNNVITLETDESTYASAITNQSSSDIFYYHNTISLTGSSTNSSALNIGSNSSNIGIINNNFVTEHSYLLEININDTSFVSNHNNFYSSDTLFCNYNNTQYNSLSAWQTISSEDASSTEINPVFISSDDLHITNSQLNNLGTGLSSVNYDIDGEARNNTTPDMGADEYTPPANDIVTIGYIGPNGQNCDLSNNETIKIIVYNNGSANQTNIPLSYKINNGTTVTETISTLATLTIDTFEFVTKADLLSGGTHKIALWSNLSNDQASYNDSLIVEVINIIPINSLPLGEDFENENMYFLLNSNEQASIEISNDANDNSSNGIIMKGGNYNGWNYSGSDFTEIKNQNYSHETVLSTCNINSTGVSNLLITLDLYMSGYSVNDNWFWVTINDTIIKDINGDSIWNCPFDNSNIIFDVTNFAGQNFALEFHGILKYTYDNNILIDNIHIWEPLSNDIGVASIYTANTGNCVTSTAPVYAIIKNYGLNSQTNFPVKILFNSSSNTNLNNTFTDTILPGAFDTIYMGILDGTKNETFNMDAFTSLTNDQETSNDSINLSFYNFAYHKINHIEDFENYNTYGSSRNTWTLKNANIESGEYTGHNSMAVTINAYSGNTNSISFDELIGKINNNSKLSFDFKFTTINNFNDTINFTIETCDGNIHNVHQITNSNFFNDNFIHTYNVPIDPSFIGEVVKIGLNTATDSQMGYSFLIDNFGIVSPNTIDIGNDTTICYGDSLQLISGFSSDSGFYSVWNGPNIINDTTDNLMANKTGTYSVIVYDYSGASLSDEIVIGYTNQISASAISNKSALCKGDSAFIEISLNGDSPLIVNWGFDGNNITDTAYGNLSDYFNPITNTDYIVNSVTDPYGCSIQNLDTISITVNNLPVISLSGFENSYCTNDESDTINASPTGGFFDGLDNETGIIDPSNLASGELQISYNVNDANGCSNIDSISLEIFMAPTAIISTVLNPSYCQTTDSVELFASPVGGTFSGSGLIGNKLFINAASTGLQEYLYTVTDNNGCTARNTVQTTINASPVVMFNTTLNDSYCKYDDTITMDVSPLGGQLIGSGITGSTLYINSAQSGYREYIYSYTDMNSCFGSDTISTTIYNPPMVSISTLLNASYCKTSDSIVINVIPLGGVYTGSGLLENVLHLSSANTGLQTYSYTFTDVNGCTAMDSVNTEINPLPTVTIPSISDICGNENTLSLTDGTPAGGNYYGNAVATSSSQFYPLIAGVGIHNIIYSFTDNNGCTASANTNLKVVTVPSADFTIDASLCRTDTATITYNSNIGPGATFNWNFDNGTITSGSDAGPYNITYNMAGIKNLSLTVADSGCTSTMFQNYTNVLEATAVSNLIGDSNACYGEDVIIFTNSGLTNSYQWFDTSGNVTSPNDTLSYLIATTSGKYYVENTNTNGCSAISNAISITINPEIISSFSIPSVACNNDMVNIIFTGNAGNTAIYNWTFDGGIIASGSNTGPFNIIWQTDSIKNVSLIVEEFGCISEPSEGSIIIETTVANITAIGNLDFCNGGSVSLSANAGPYSYKWFRDGINTNSTQPIFSTTEAGVYTVEVTNINTLCSSISDSVVVIVNTDDFNIAFTASQTSFNIPPFNVNINNQTANANNYYWMWSFGDGNSSTFVNPSHQYNFDGDYSIGVIAQDVNTGCFDTLIKNDYISCSGGNADPCNLDASFGNIGGPEICSTDSIKFFANDHTADVTYQWLRDGIILSGATDSVYYGRISGLYQLLIADATCSEFSQPFSLTQLTTITPSIIAIGSIQPCTNDSMELFVSTSFNSYQWSNGETSPNIFIKTSGIYFVTITDNNGCTSFSDPLVVNASLLEVPNICIVGIDSATNLNRVIWERENNNLVDSFRIYRESTVSNVYNQIGSQAFSDLSVFTDVNSNPAQMAYRYRITAIDTCGMETPLSPIHKTLHLTINAGLGGVWNLIWTNYEGFNFGSYKIYRSSDSTNMQLLTQIQSNLTSYTDLNPPTGNVYYQIEIVSPHACYPDSVLSKANTNYNTSRSNTSNTANAINIGIYSHQKFNVAAKIYPNPNNGLFTFEIGNIGINNLNLSIINTLGSEVYNTRFTTKGSNTIRQIDLNGLAKGVYFIRLKTKEGIVYRGKVVIN